MYQKLITLLDTHKAHYRLIDHAPEGRTEIVSPLRGNKLSQAAKCMVLTVHMGKKEIKYVLAVIPGDKKIDFDAVKTLMDASYVSFAPTQTTEEMSGSVVGTVLPFSFHPDLELIVDPMLLENTDELFFNAARLDRSMALSTKDYVSIVKPRLEKIALHEEMHTQKIPEADLLDHLRHSTAHLLAAAVMNLWPDTKRTIGPSIENGFYYDFEFSQPISETDLPAIEAEMRKIAPTWKKFERHELTPAQAKKGFPHNPYKHELIDEFSNEGQVLTFYKSGDYWDLCRGGHVENPSKELKYFKLLSLAGAYWRGDEKNKMLTRIYGTAFPTQKELDAHLKMLEEAKKRDHRKLGIELDLFTTSDLVGAGLPLFTPRGTIIRDELEGYVAELNKQYGYQKVWIPHIGKPELYKISGHWDKFSDNLFHVKGAHDEFVIKPMNCPHHTQIYASKARSYKDLPVRLHETTTIYRDEKSGQLGGLTRVRSITQDDGHTFLRPDQIEDEFDTLLTIQRKVLGAVGLTDYWISLSLRDPNNKKAYLGDDAVWEQAQAMMHKILTKKGIAFKPIEGEAAFYGPKMDLVAKDSIGREWQLSTIQLDFNMPRRFGLEYTDKDGSKQTPIMIHRAFMGSTERFIGVLIEHFAGAFPVWLSPVQVAVLPVKTDHNEPAARYAQELRAHGIRASVDDSNETIGNKIRKASGEKIPYQLVFGDKEINSDELMVRIRGEKDQKKMTRQGFLTTVTTQISTRAG